MDYIVETNIGDRFLTRDKESAIRLAETFVQDWLSNGVHTMKATVNTNHWKYQDLTIVSVANGKVITQQITQGV